MVINCSKKFILFVCFSLICFQTVVGQFRLSQISGPEGLSQNTVHSIVQDDNGFLWIGSYDGINKYDGYSMQYFKYSNSDYGLNSNIIKSLFEDSDHNIWAGTTSGLNRIDAITSKVTHFFNDPPTIEYFNDLDNNLYQSDQGSFFFNLTTGLTVFDVDSLGNLGPCKTLQAPKDVKAMPEKIIKSTKSGHWFYTPENPVKLFKTYIKNSQNNFDVTMQPTSIVDPFFETGYMIDMIEDANNTLWVLSNKLQLLSIKLDDNLQVIEQNKIDLLNEDQDFNFLNLTKVIMQFDQSNRLWIGGNGLLLNYDINSKKVIDLKQTKNLNVDFSFNQIQHLFIDRSNILWLGTSNEGVFKMDLENTSFSNSIDFTRNSKTYSSKFKNHPIQAMTEDHQGNLWLGLYEDGGLGYINESTLRSTLSNSESSQWGFKFLDAFRSDNIKRLMTDHRGDVWVGSQKGLNKVSYSASLAKHVVSNFNGIKNLDGHLIDDTVFAIDEDRYHNIWVGYWGSGLVKLSMNPKSQRYSTTIFQQKTHNPSSLSSNYVRDVLEDTAGNLWVGTISGLNFSKSPLSRELSFTSFFNDTKNSKSLNNNYVLDIFQARDGTIYVGTFGGGLNIVKDSKNPLDFLHVTSADGLPSDTVYQIKEDDDGRIWMLHVREISMWDPITKVVKYYQLQDGFSVTEFKDNAMIYTKSGMIVAGGSNGFTFMNSKGFSVNKTPPQLQITDLKLFDTSVKPFQKINGQVILKNTINNTSLIHLPFNQNSIEFVFSSLHFSNPEKNQYKFKLEGFEEKWQHSTGNVRRFASYTNLSPGTYVFKLMGSNSEGVWSDEIKEVKLIIASPWYLQPWVLGIFLVLILSAVIGLVKIRLNQIRLKSQIQLESVLHEKSEELNRMKLQFFTNISHELRTPLTLIIGPLQQIMSGQSDVEYLKKLNSVMLKNSKRLLKLINQLMDFRKAESGNLNLLVHYQNLSSFVYEIYEAFEEIASNKRIKFLIINDDPIEDAWFDSDKIEKIIYNLLSNAFKYTPKGKTIQLTLKKVIIDGIAHAELKVIDFGVGISKEHLSSVFDRFYQAKEEPSFDKLGTGLGLTFVKRLIEIHKGSVHIESELHQGTTCTVTFPIDKSAFNNDTVIDHQPQYYDFNYTKIGVEAIQESIIPILQNANPVVHTSQAPTLLIVEDNQELLAYLKTVFEISFKVLTAVNGKIGLELAQSQLPDIIISDLMMPIMDGLQMCRTLKTDINTSHIPVIILTAKSGLENEKIGLETGADEFVLKPFNIEVLQLRVENIVRTKAQWIKKFSNEKSTQSWKELSNKIDQDFLQKAVKIIKNNIDNPNFSVETFSREIGMSRSSLFNKIKSITGKSTSEFIRNIRLKRAVKLLKSGTYSITEVVYLSGFMDPKYFRTCFKKQHGKTPSEFIKDFKKSGL